MKNTSEKYVQDTSTYIQISYVNIFIQSLKISLTKAPPMDSENTVVLLFNNFIIT